MLGNKSILSMRGTEHIYICCCKMLNLVMYLIIKRQEILHLHSSKKPKKLPYVLSSHCTLVVLNGKRIFVSVQIKCYFLDI